MNHTENEWKTAGRRKINRGLVLTTFYVGNIPEEVSSDDLKAVFVDYGRVVNVYIAKKKDIHGTNFGFVKFSGVEDAKKLEGSLNKVHLGNNILKINIARFQDKKLIHPPQSHGFVKHQSHSLVKPKVHNHPPPSAWNLRDNKSFASVVSSSNAISKPNPLRIYLKPSEDIDNTLFSSFLFGEVSNLDTLKAIPNLLKDAGIMVGKVFYYGGLCVLIGFDEDADASNFLNNNGCWKQWFTWLKRGDSITNWGFERIIDVKIVGLPMKFRTIENIQNILSHHGRILDTTHDNVWKFVDISYVNVCILTKSKTKINEEVIVEHGNGKHFSIGLVEDACFINPFTTDGTDLIDDNMETDHDSREDGSDDGISETCSIVSVKNVIPTIEEGEFLPDDDNKFNSPVNVVEESVLNVEDGAINDDIGNTDVCRNNRMEVEKSALNNRMEVEKSAFNVVGETINADNIGSCTDRNISACTNIFNSKVDVEGACTNTINSKVVVDSACTNDNSPVLSHTFPTVSNTTVNSALDGSCFIFGTSAHKKKGESFRPLVRLTSLVHQTLQGFFRMLLILPSI